MLFRRLPNFLSFSLNAIHLFGIIIYILFTLNTSACFHIPSFFFTSITFLCFPCVQLSLYLLLWFWTFFRFFSFVCTDFSLSYLISFKWLAHFFYSYFLQKAKERKKQICFFHLLPSNLSPSRHYRHHHQTIHYHLCIHTRFLC